MAEVQYFTWQDFDEAVNKLTPQIQQGLNEARQKGEPIQGLYGIPRGGLILAVALSHRLELPLIVGDNARRFSEIRLLVVDEISDTGRTLNAFWGVSNIGLVATIHKAEGSRFNPDYYVHIKPSDTWIVYPWEEQVCLKPLASKRML